MALEEWRASPLSAQLQTSVSNCFLSIFPLMSRKCFKGNLLVLLWPQFMASPYTEPYKLNIAIVLSSSSSLKKKKPTGPWDLLFLYFYHWNIFFIPTAIMTLYFNYFIGSLVNILAFNLILSIPSRHTHTHALSSCKIFGYLLSRINYNVIQ